MVHSARVVEMGVLHQPSAGAGCLVVGSMESPGKPSPGFPKPAVRLAGWIVGRTGLRWNRLCPDRIGAAGGSGGRDRSDCPLVLGNALAFAHGSAPPLPFQ